MVNQTYKNLEIILVDDGSIDKLGYICNNWAKKDKRITVYHTKNYGVCHVRNIGLKNAHGLYVGFVDPDDFVDKPFYEKMVQGIVRTNSDICCGGYKKFDLKGKIEVV